MLDGGEGADTLLGGPGDDTLDRRSGPRHARRRRTAPTRASYIDGPPVIVDLADPGPDGPPDAPDTVIASSVLRQPRSRTSCAATPGPNLLQGGAGDDVVDGRDGDDELDGAKGSTTVCRRRRATTS